MGAWVVKILVFAGLLVGSSSTIHAWPWHNTYDINRPFVHSDETYRTSPDRNLVHHLEVFANIGINWEIPTVVGPQWIEIFCIQEETSTGALSSFIRFPFARYFFKDTQTCIELSELLRNEESIRIVLNEQRKQVIKAVRNK